MAWEAWYTVVVVILLIVGLARSWAAPDILCVGALTALMVVRELSQSDKLPKLTDAIAGFGNSGLLTVGVLFVVVTGLVQTGAMTLITRPLLGMPRSVSSVMARLTFPVAAISAFLNNTPVVAMFMPVVDDLCKRMGVSPSKLFMPLSYAAVLGGTCTLIGTSTNLVVNGLVISQTDMPGIGMFDITWIGIPCALVGLTYLMLFNRFILPERKPPISMSDDPRQYTVEMIVQAPGPLVGKSIEDAGLRNLPGLYLAEIERDSRILPAVGPQERLEANDRLVFVGIVESVVDLQKMRGLTPATDQLFKLDSSRIARSLIEAVVSDRCPLIGKSIREGRFRTRYNAAVLAVARSGKRINAKIGDVVLQSGDTLLLEAHQSFAEQQRNSTDFFLVSRIENSAPTRHERAWVALAILIAMVAVATIGWMDILPAAMVAAGLMIITRCCTGPEARRSVDWPVLIVIGAALGIGQALETSGAAQVIAGNLIGLAQGHPWVVLGVVYFVTMLFTELITNNAAAALVFPIALSSAETLGVSFMPFIIVIMMAASASFSTPIGYQTNLMVYGPGGYQFTDYLRAGIPMNLLMMTVTVAITPFVWPF
ncbi:MAG TPA: SLC13 family permease [Thermodesulfobacteriota bacterium]|nr:SLC13 family permease [Thermodesulfobacteriota bacterium]